MDARLYDRLTDHTRVLGEQERLIHTVHNMGGLVGASALRLRGPLEAHLVRRALDWLQRRRALLNAHIVYRGFGFTREAPFIHRRPYFVTQGTTPIPLRVVDNAAPGDWHGVYQRELRTRFGHRRNPLIRATLVRETPDLNHLIVATDHTICDAQTAMTVIRDIMEFLGDPDSAPGSNDTRLPPALEQGFRPSSDSTHRYERAHRLPLRRVRGVPVETLCEMRQLTTAETDAINAAARSHRTTLHGAVGAAVLTAVGRHFGLDTMTCLTNIELRKLSRPPLPADTFGCYIDAVRTTHRLDLPFWDLAADVVARLVGTMARHETQSSILKLPGADHYRYETIPTMLGGMVMDGVGVTTAGDSGIRRDYGDLVLEEMTGTVSMNPFGVGLFVVAMQFQGGLRLNLAYGSRRLPASDAAAVADIAADLLRHPPAD